MISFFTVSMPATQTSVQQRIPGPITTVPERCKKRYAMTNNWQLERDSSTFGPQATIFPQSLLMIKFSLAVANLV